ncbi:MAG: hypothetical protein HY521_01865, partial [Proteobacteria bacterium]|nr:hypothetical protein [Pseudomonadota bacterium]
SLSKTTSKFCPRKVCTFEMKNQRGFTDYYLFFATNKLLGMSKMKEAMWKVDESGEFTFSDSTDPNQLVLFEKEPKFEILRRQIVDRFRGGTVGIREIAQYVVSETAFCESHIRRHVLKLLEFADPPAIEVIGGTVTRRRGTYGSDALRIRFK